jgi:hypothetical protein
MQEHTESGSKTVGYHHKKNSWLKPVIGLVVVVILCGVSFYGGTNYQKHRGTTVTNASATGSAASRFGGGSGGGYGGGYSGTRPIRGQVTAVSATSITVQDSTTGSSSTFAINSSTTITDSSQTVTTTDIQTGDTVLTVASSSSSTTASRILVNPTAYGGGQSSQTAPSTNAD